MMEDDCVEKRKWLSKGEFTEMLGITNMLPGPNATEMAIHIGHARRGRLGGIVAGLGFTIPSFVIILALSWLYFRYGAMPGVDGFFYGINPVVIGIILVTLLRLGKSSITDPKLAVLFAATLLATQFTKANEALIMLLSGFVGILLYAPALRRVSTALVFMPLALPTLAIAVGSLPIMLQLFLEFLKASCLMFGTGLVIIPLTGPDIVESFGWMSYREFFDGVTLGQVSPGPVMKTAGFVGYKVAGVPGATAAFWAIFLPPFFIVTLLAPFYRRMRRDPWLQGFLKGVKVGAAATILGAVVSMAPATFTDLLTVAIAAASFVATLKLKVNLSLLVIGAGALGVMTRLL